MQQNQLEELGLAALIGVPLPYQIHSLKLRDGTVGYCGGKSLGLDPLVARRMRSRKAVGAE